MFSTNQVMQLYVAKSKKAAVSGVTTAGDIAITKDAENNVYFTVKGADAKQGLMRSDLIPIKNIISAKAVNASTMQHSMKKVKVTLNSAALDGGKLINGEDYMVRIVINPYIGMSDIEPYLKYGIVHAAGNMTPSDFYKKLAISLAKNFSRELDPMLKFSVVASGTGEGASDVETEVTALTKESALTGTYKGVIIEEIEQEWRRGIKQQTFVNFDVIPTKIIVSGDEATWGTAEEVTSSTILNNGKKIADLEYFCMGERGDQYRGIGWPNNIETTYMVNPENAYHVFNIHFAFTDEGVAVQKSEKEIVIVSDVKSELNSLITAFNTATGLSVATLA